MWKSFSLLFWISLFLFAANQVLEQYVTLTFVHAYLDDLLCGPIVLGAALAFFQKLLSSPGYTFPVSYIIFFGLWYSLFFEFIYPSYDLRHHRDLWDIVAYAASCALFFKFGNKPLSATAVKGKNEVRKNAVQTRGRFN